MSVWVRAGRGKVVGVGAYEFVSVAKPLASISRRCRDKLSVTMQNSRSVGVGRGGKMAGHGLLLF